MKRRIFHLYLKATGEHKYYGSLAAVFIENDLGVSKFTLDRFNFDAPFKNDVCELRKGFLYSTGDLK